MQQAGDLSVTGGRYREIDEDREIQQAGGISGCGGHALVTNSILRWRSAYSFFERNTGRRASAVRQAIAGSTLLEKPWRVARRGARSYRLAERARSTRCGAGQAVAAGPAETRESPAARLLRPHPFGARRIRLLGVRRRPRAAQRLPGTIARRGRRHHGYAVPLALMCSTIFLGA